jgi:GT2 family glycosyltransferase
MKNKLALITVSINKNAIVDFIESINKQTSSSFHVYIVDVSADHSLTLDKSDKYSIIPSKNKGYAAGINRGIKAAMSDDIHHFCIINDDTYFEEDFVENAQQLLSHYSSTILGGKIYYAAGHEYHKNRYGKSELGKVIWYAGGIVDWSHATATHRGVDEVDAGQYNVSQPTQFVTGCLMLFDQTVIDRIGYMDESYFLYFEDADYCQRANRNGIHMRYEPSLVLWHKVSLSTHGSGSRLHQKYQSKNLVKFALKYAPLRTKVHIVKNYFLNIFAKYRR